jgi:hypothetical protein
MTNTRLSVAILRTSLTLFGLGVTCAASAVDVDRELERENERALSAYRGARVRVAKSTLQKAAASAKRAGKHGPALARTYANLGIVLASGAKNHDRAVRAFRRALREDPQITPDRTLTTPAVSAAFREAALRSDAPLPDEDEDDSTPRGEPDTLARADDAADAADGAAVRSEREAATDTLPRENVARPPVPTPWEVAARDWEDVETTKPNARETSEPDAHDEAHAGAHEHPRWFIEMGIGVGFSALRQGHAPDRLPDSLGHGEHAAAAEGDGAQHAEHVDTSEIERDLREEGWDCDARARGGEVHAEDCVVAARPGVSVMEPIFDMAVGYHVLPRLALALTALVQRNHGEGPMAGVLVGVRSEYLLTAPADRGPQFGAIAGFGVGTLQARGRGTHHDAPHVSNAGPGAIGASVTLGAKGAYRANRHLAVGMTPLLNIGLPHVLYDVGLTGGVEVAFRADAPASQAANDARTARSSAARCSAALSATAS